MDSVTALTFCLLVGSVYSLKVPSSITKPLVGSTRLNAIGFDTHKAVEKIPETLVRTIDGNDSMRRKFESLCREWQVCV
jgi:hypothetical protein